ncbi:D-glucuronyl C5-epimerase family protein [Nocardiopsis coralliicola]
MISTLVASCTADTGPVSGTAAQPHPRSAPTATASVAPLPPLTEMRPELQEYYRIAFLPDGYPGRRSDDGESVWAHPMYGVYVLRDYLAQYRKDPAPRIRDAISAVARAAVARMDRIDGSLAFYYDDPDHAVKRQPERHYSGLTQAYYAVELHRAGTLLGNDALVRAAADSFASLLVPVEDGGVYQTGPYGPGIAEVPQQPASWILNGWQSALTSVAAYAELTGSPRAERLLRESAAAMADMLPLYDVEELANSRYSLSGHVRMRIRSAAPLSDIAVAVPGEGAFPVTATEGTKWQNYIVEGAPEKGGSIELNTILSRISHPEPNRLRFTAQDPAEVTVEIARSTYDPGSAGLGSGEWTPVARLSADGATSVEIPWKDAELVAYPTNFSKEIGGERTNVYHHLHIQRLRQLADAADQPQFGIWADRWSSYVCDWPEIDAYAGLSTADPNGSAEERASCD